jgi:hypothetical protein
MHDHPVPETCEHELKHCKKCDVVYCEKCKGEWVKRPPYSFEDVKKKFEQCERQRPIKYPPEWYSWPLVKKHKEVLCTEEGYDHDSHC